MFKNPFSFNGRIRRREYGVSWLVWFPAVFTAALVIGVVNDLVAFKYDTKALGGVFILVAIGVPALWFIIAQGVKRCHDLGKSGWWFCIPFYGFIVFFVDGDLGDNKYGLNPKGRYYKEDSHLGVLQQIDNVDESGRLA